MIKLLSYIFPITKTIPSDYNGVLEITWYNGKKYLNTKNANYSYGSLQNILKYGLKQVSLNNINSVLLLGLGGGSVIQTLREDFHYRQHITAIEIDPVVITIAKDEFGITDDDQLQIICDDALNFITNTSLVFDLIIIDVFIDTTVPEVFMSEVFWTHILTSKTTSGTILFNAAVNKTEPKNVKTIIAFLKVRGLNVDTHFHVEATNTLVIAT